MEVSTFLNLFAIKKEYINVDRKKVVSGQIEVNNKLYTGLEKIGKGYNADVYCCYNNKDENYVLKVGDPVSLAVEYAVYKDLQKLGFSVISTYPSDNFQTLGKPYLDLNFFGNKFSSFSEIQKEDLKKLWKKSCQYALITGIPLDLKADNLWWDASTNQWFLADTGPKLDDDDAYKFEYTLDLKNADDFVSRIQGKKSESAETVKFVENQDSKLITLKMKNFSYILKPNKIIEYKEELRVYTSFLPKLIKTYLKENEKLSQVLFLLKFMPLSQEILDLVGSNIALSKKVCEVLSMCAVNPDINKSVLQFRESVSKITELRNDTAKYHSSLSYEDKKVLTAYTATAYKDMNACLREGNEKLNCPSYLQKIIMLDKILSSVNAPRLTHNLVVYRAINEYKDEEAKKIALALKNLISGDYWEDRGFVSTSVQHPPTDFLGTNCCIFEIHLPVGTPAYYIGEDSSVSHEEEVILLPGILLQFVEKKNILYKGERNVNGYVFKCAGCADRGNNRFMLSHAPEPLQIKDIPRLKFQPQETGLGKDKLSFYHLTNMYNKFIPVKTKNVLRIMTWNVHEWRNANKSSRQDEILAVIRNMNPDILGLQEVTKSVVENTQAYKYNILECQADKGSYGETLKNSLIVKKGINKITEFETSIKHDRCMVVYGIQLAETKVLVANVHLDVSSSERRRENISIAVNYVERIAEKEDIENIVIMGDFNSYNKTDYDNKTLDVLTEMKKSYSGKDIFEVVDYLEEKGYRDTFGLRRAKGAQIPANTNIYGGRIDFVFISKAFTLPLKASYVYYNDFSDHVAIIVDFSLENYEISEAVENSNKQKTDYNFEKSENKPNLDFSSQKKLNEDLLKFVKEGNFKRVKEVVEMGADVNDDDIEPLLWASGNGYLPVVKYLVERGANINANDDAALTSASENGHLPVVKYLVENRADIHAQNDLTLIWASENGHLPVVKYLVEHGANIYAQNDLALKLAIENKHTDVVEYLKSTNSAKSNKPQISEALQNKLNQQLFENIANLEKVKYLIRQGADIHAEYDYAFLLASGKGHLETVKYLVEHGANIHAEYDYAFLMASDNGHLEIVKYLVRHGADIHAQNDSALRRASKYGQLLTVKYLVEQGAYIDSNESEALRSASENGHFSVVKYLVERGSDINAIDNYALKLASEFGHFPIVKYLVEHGANIHAEDDNALRVASEFGHLEIVKYLVERGANIDSKESLALRAASQNRHSAVVEYLKSLQ